MTGIVLGIFAAVVAIVLGAYWFFILRPEGQAAGVVRKRLKKTVDAGARRDPSLLRNESPELSSVEALDTALRRVSGITTPLETMIQQSGVQITVAMLLLASLSLGLLVFLLASMVLRLTWVGVIAAPLAAWAPIAYVRYKRTRRIEKFEEQFPEALDLFARSLRAGHAFSTGMSLVAEELPEPIGPEFQLLYDRQNYGMPFADALRDFGQRIPVLDAKFFVTAVLTQREAGGNLAEVLGNLSSVIRERFRVKRQVRVLSAHGRITGWVLACFPPFLACMFLASSDQHLQTLWGDPLGQQMVYGAVVLQIVGTIIIRKLVQIEY